MTPEERADKVEIVEEDCGDWHVSDWRVSEDKTRANIANAIREAERDAELRMRERCAKVAKDIANECRVKRVVKGDLERNYFGGGLNAAEDIDAAIRALEVS